MKIKNEKGAVPIIEATILFPIIILIMFFLMYLGLYCLQIVTMYTQAEKVATLVAKQIALPGYETLSADTMKSIFVDFDEAQSGVDVDSIYDDDNERLYRYFSEKIVDEDTLEKNTNEAVKKLNILAASGNITCTIDADNYFVSQKINVEITKPITVPDFFSYIGLGNLKKDIVVTASASSCDGAEFVRDVDTVYDFTVFLADKLKITSTITSFMDKIKSATSKYSDESAKAENNTK